MADITQVQAAVAQDEEVTDVPVYQKNGEPYRAADGSVATIGVLGRESKRYRQAADQVTRKLLRAGKSKFEPADIRQNRVDVAVAAVVRWHGWESQGKAWPCEPENVKVMLSVDHILEQVEAGITGHADFFANRSPS